jgi:Ras-related protein Rab-8A
MIVLSTVRPFIFCYILVQSDLRTDIRTWHANIEQHASEGVNKVLIGNKSDWTDRRAVTQDEGRELAEELGIKFIETSAKVNEGVEEAFFTLARCVNSLIFFDLFFSWVSFSDIKARLIDSQADAANAPSSAAPDSIKVNQPSTYQAPSCCT